MVLIKHAQDQQFKMCIFEVEGGWLVQIVDWLTLVHQDTYASAYGVEALGRAYGFEVEAFGTHAVGCSIAALSEVI